MKLSRRLPGAALVAVVAAAACWTRAAADIEVLEEWGCQDTAFRLTCRGLDATIALLEASFSAKDVASIFLGANKTCGTPLPGKAASAASAGSAGPRAIRLSLNHRCSGVNHCSFILNNDLPASRDWGPGLVYVKYACVSGPHLHHYCSSSTQLNVTEEGFLQSPGYPTVTVGELSCLWRIRAGPGQRLHLAVLDLSLRARGPGEASCTDVLAIREGGEGNVNQVLECGEADDTVTLESDRGALDVNLTTRSLNAFPSRGVLIHYKAVGCPSLSPPTDGYLVHQNDSVAWYMCCVGFVFSDTEERARTLLCENGNTWNDSLPGCVNISLTPSGKNHQGHQTWKLADHNVTVAGMAAGGDMEGDTVYNIIVPTVIMAALFIGNAVILFFVFILRKRNKLQRAEDEERAAIVHSKGAVRVLPDKDGNVSPPREHELAAAAAAAREDSRA